MVCVVSLVKKNRPFLLKMRVSWGASAIVWGMMFGDYFRWSLGRV